MDQEPKPMTIEEIAQKLEKLEREQEVDARAIATLEVVEKTEKGATTGSKIPPSAPEPTAQIPENEPLLEAKPKTEPTLPPTPASAPVTPSPTPEKKKKSKDKKETAPKTPAEEIKDFVGEFNLGPLLPPEFESLNETQKLKVIRDLKRRIVDIVKSDAQIQYSEELKKRVAATAIPAGSKLATSLRTFKNLSKAIGTSVKSSVTKERDLQNIEGQVFAKIRDTEEGKKLVVQDLRILTEKTQQREVYISKRGNACFYYLPRETYNEVGEEAFENFNGYANTFSFMPYEWGQEKSGGHKKEYEKVKVEYEKAREEILKIKTSREGFGAAAGTAMLEMLEIDNAIQMEQLLNTHPEFEKFEKALNEFGESAGGKEITKRTLKSFFTSNSASKANIGIGITGAGIRFGAKVGLGFTTFAASGMFVAAPVIGAVAGYWRGKIRGKKTLEERKKGARHGQKDENKEANKIVRADNMAKYLDNIIQELNGSCTDKKRAALVERLRIRIIVTQEKIERGLMDFGNAQSALKNQFDLVNNLNAAIIEQYKHEHGKDLKERIEKLLSFRSDKINEAQDAFVKKQALRGAAMGAGFATAGYTLRYVWEHIHFGEGHGINWGNPADSLEHIEMEIKDLEKQLENLQKELENIEKPQASLPSIPKGPINPFHLQAEETPLEKKEKLLKAIQEVKRQIADQKATAEKLKQAKLPPLDTKATTKPATLNLSSKGFIKRAGNWIDANKFWGNRTIHNPDGSSDTFLKDKIIHINSRGLKENVKLLDGKEFHYVYDGNNKLTHIEEKLQDGSIRTYVDDRNWELKEEQGPNNSSLKRYFKGKTWYERLPDGTRKEYYPSGKLERIVQPDGSSVIYKDGTETILDPNGKVIQARSAPVATVRTSPATSRVDSPVRTPLETKIAKPSPMPIRTPMPKPPALPIDEPKPAVESIRTPTIEPESNTPSYEVPDTARAPLAETNEPDETGAYQPVTTEELRDETGEPLPDTAETMPTAIESDEIGIHQPITTEGLRDEVGNPLPEDETMPISPTEPAPSTGSNSAEAVRIRRGIIEKIQERDNENMGNMPERAQIEEMPRVGDVIRQDDTEIRVTGVSKGVGYNYTFGPANPSSGNSPDYIPSGTRGEFFPGISERENLILRTHPEFVQDNPFHLTGTKLVEAYELGQKNIAHILNPDNNSIPIDEWNEAKNAKAALFFDKDAENSAHPVTIYMHKLKDITKLNPKSGILGMRPETTEHYIARALQWIARYGNLNDAKLE